MLCVLLPAAREPLVEGRRAFHNVVHLPHDSLLEHIQFHNLDDLLLLGGHRPPLRPLRLLHLDVPTKRLVELTKGDGAAAVHVKRREELVDNLRLKLKSE